MADIFFYSEGIAKEEIEAGHGMGLLSMLRNETSETLNQIIERADRENNKVWRHVKAKAKQVLPGVLEREQQRLKEEEQQKILDAAHARHREYVAEFEAKLSANLPHVKLKGTDTFLIEKVPYRLNKSRYNVVHVGSSMLAAKEIEIHSIAKRLIAGFMVLGYDFAKVSFEEEELRQMRRVRDYITGNGRL